MNRRGESILKRGMKGKSSSGYEESFDGLDMKDLVQVKDDFLPSPEAVAQSLRKAKMTVIMGKLPTRRRGRRSRHSREHHHFKSTEGLRRAA